MKTIKKLFAFLLVVMMLASVCSLSAFALDDEEAGNGNGEGDTGSVVTTETVTIKVHADDSYKGAAADNDRTYQWHRVFTATYVTPHSNTSNDFSEGDAAATPFDLSSTPKDGAVAYIASNAVAAKLGSWAEGAWTRAEGNDWFDLYPAATGGYVVKWVGEDITSTTAQAAARWLLENEAYEASGDLTYNDAGVWSANVVMGYFLIESSAGENLIAATTDIEVYEKNTYPSVDKQEKDADQADFSATLGKNEGGDNAQTKSKVAVGDIIDYTVTVHVPANANADIVAYDIMSKGLELVADSLAVTINGVAADTAAWEETTTKADKNPTWEITIHPTKDVAADEEAGTEAVVGTRGKDVVIAFQAKVTADALVDSGRRNDATIEYDNDKFEATDFVEYTTYFTGIEKVDGASVAEGKKPEDKEPLEGVKFNLQAVAKNAAEGTEPAKPADFKVSPVKKGGTGDDKDDVLYYVPDANGSSKVVTDKNGMIKIRGLDNDKTYTLTETEALPGYNVMQGSITLALMEDTFTTSEENGEVTTTYAIDSATFAQVQNNKGTELPSTGGIGTTIFYVVGGLLLVGAGVLLITKKRMEH